MPAGEHDRVVLGAVGRVQRDAGEVELLEHVGVAELGRERQAEHVEALDRAVAVDGERRHARLAHEAGEVGPDAVAALGQHARLLVEHLVEDHDALVRQPDLVGVRVHDRPADVALLPGLDLAVELPADVLDRLLHLGEQRLEAGEQADAGEADTGEHVMPPRLRGSRGRAARPGRPVGQRRDRSATAAQVDVLQQPDGEQVGEHRRPAVGHERQRQPGHRHDPERHPDVDEALEGEPADDAGGHQPAEGVGRADGDPAAPPQHDAEQQHEPAGADQAELLPRDGEDEVGLLLGDEGAVGLRPLEQALAEEPTRADGDAGLLVL